MFEVEQWPASVIIEYKALNYLDPYTDNAQAQRDGLQLALTHNAQVRKKKDLKTAHDFLPYLKPDPEWLKPKIIKDAEKFIKLARTSKMLDFTLEKIVEEINTELAKDKPDQYIVSKLARLVHEAKQKQK